MAADGSVIIDTRMDTTGVQNGVSAIKQSFNGLGSAVKKIGLLIGGAFAVGKLVQFGKECVELGSDLSEVQNVVDVTFTTMSDKVNEFAKNAMTSAGLSETMAKRYVGTFGAMSKSFGFSEAQAYDMSTALTQLTGDVASFYNISQDLAYIKLKSVFTGETETLKDLGVVMTQSALDQYALANGYGKTTSEMTEQEKVALRLAFVQKQLSAASGDFIRTSDSWANQVRVMQLQLQSLKATVGQGLINIFTPVLKVINILLGKLATLANAFKSFTELITGKKSSGQTSGGGAGLTGTDVIADTADQYGQAADNAEQLADATNDTAKATKKANKEAKNYLSSLDEVHKVSSTEGTSLTPSGFGSGGTGSGGGGLPSSAGSVDYGSLAEGENALDKISDSTKKLAGLLKKLWKPFQDAWEKEGKATITAAKTAFSSLGSLIASIGSSFATVWTNGSGERTLTNILKIVQHLFATVGNLAQAFKTAWEYAGTGTSIIQNIFDIGNSILGTIEKITGATADWAKTLDFTPLLTSINTLLQNLQPLTDNIGTGLEWFWNNVLLPIGSWTIQDAVPTFLQMLSSGITVVNSVIEALQPLGSWLWDNFLQPLGQWTGDLVIAAMQTLSNLLDRFSTWIQNNQELVRNVTIVIGSFFAAFELHSIISGAVTAVTNFVGLITGGGGLLGALSSVVAALGGPVTIAIGAVIAAGVLLWRNWDSVKEAAGKLKEWVVDKTVALKDGAVEAFEKLKTNAGNALKVLRDNVKQKWEAIKSKFTSFSTWLSGAFNTDWTKQFGIFGGVLNGFFKSAKDVIKDVKGIFKGLNTFVSGTFSGNWSQAWEGIKTIFSNVFSGLADIAKTPINAIIGGFNSVLGVVNGLISKLNNLKFRITVPNWIPGIGGSWWGFNGFSIPTIGTIPMLASGAVIPPRSEFLAVLGDQKNGRNLEAPEGVIREIIDDAFARHQQGGSGNFRFTAQLNRRTIFDEMIDEAKLRRDASGTNPFELA
nr:MAG TPA: minor tail protein [Bacteriophage sp.]